MTAWPTGTITLLFTDIEGSTRLWEQYPDAMRPALARHDELLRTAIEHEGGVVFKTIGDAFCAAFASANAALLAALAAQLALQREAWQTPDAIRVRMALHSGSAELRDQDYFGPALNRTARLLAAAHGGQTLLSQLAQELSLNNMPEGCTLLAKGEHQLKDLAQPEQVFQLCHPALPASFPPLRTLSGAKHNLPAQLTSFVGREAEMQTLRQLLASHRLVTLTGVGGCGKTRLCLHTAADLLEQYPDGIWLAELAPVSDPQWIPQAVAGALGLKEEGGTPLLQTVCTWLKGRTALLLLDNCEHLLEGAARFCEALLRQCPTVRILASSREGLGIAGEQTMRIPSLAEREAVELFVERARLQQPLFALEGSNRTAVEAVCARLDGIPLAIELAAARVRAMSVEQIGDRLDQRFRLLTGGSRHLLPRQQTLRALIDWSYDLLGEGERLLLARVSVFVGGFSLEGCEGICSGGLVEEWEVLDLLTSLVDKSLVQYEGGRYRLLETVRQYGLEKLAEFGEAEAVRGHHRDWYAKLAAEAKQQMEGPQQVEWFFRLELEHGNFCAALEWCIAEGNVEAVSRGLQMSADLQRFWEVRGHWQAGRELLEGLFAARKGGEDASAEAGALCCAGAMSMYQGAYHSARGQYEQALAIYQEIGERNCEAACMNGLGSVALNTGDYSAAREQYEQALVIRREIGDRNGEAGCLNNLGLVALNTGDHSAAREYLEQALAMHQALHNRNREAWCLNNLGFIVLNTGDYPAAGEFLKQSLVINQEIQNRALEEINLYGLASVSLNTADYAAARSCYEQSLVICREIGNMAWEAGCMNGLGSVALHTGDYSAARGYYEQALAINREIGNRAWEAISLYGLGSVALQAGDYTAARGYLEQALAVYLAVYSEIGNAPGQIEVLEGFAGYWCAVDEHMRAARLYGASATLRTDLGMPLSPSEAVQQKQWREACEAALGTEQYALCQQEGRALTLEQAVSLALQQ